MVHVKFKNLEKSESIKEIVEERISETVEKFPKGKPRTVVVTLAMDNSPQQPGPDVFRVRTEILGGRYHGLILEKEAVDLYLALADVCEHLLERLNRFSDRVRTKALKKRRQFSARTRSKRSVLPEGGKL